MEAIELLLVRSSNCGTYCMRFPNGEEVYATEATLCRSPVIANVVSAALEEDRYAVYMHAPAGLVLNWILAVECIEQGKDLPTKGYEAHASMILALKGADFLHDQDALDRLCRTISSCVVVPNCPDAFALTSMVKNEGYNGVSVSKQADIMCLRLHNSNLLNSFPAHLVLAVMKHMPKHSLSDIFDAVDDIFHVDVVQAFLPEVLHSGSLVLEHSMMIRGQAHFHDEDCPSGVHQRILNTVSRLSHLKHLSLKLGWLASIQCILSGMSNLTCLTFLHLEAAQKLPEVLPALKSLRALELVCMSPEGLSEAFLMHSFAHCSLLERLKLQGGLKDAFFSGSALARSLKQISNLQTLQLQVFSGAFDKHLHCEMPTLFHLGILQGCLQGSLQESHAPCSSSVDNGCPSGLMPGLDNLCPMSAWAQEQPVCLHIKTLHLSRLLLRCASDAEPLAELFRLCGSLQALRIDDLEIRDSCNRPESVAITLANGLSHLQSLIALDMRIEPCCSACTNTSSLLCCSRSVKVCDTDMAAFGAAFAELTTLQSVRFSAKCSAVGSTLFTAALCALTGLTELCLERIPMRAQSEFEYEESDDDDEFEPEVFDQAAFELLIAGDGIPYMFDIPEGLDEHDIFVEGDGDAAVDGYGSEGDGRDDEGHVDGDSDLSADLGAERHYYQNAATDAALVRGSMDDDADAAATETRAAVAAQLDQACSHAAAVALHDGLPTCSAPSHAAADDAGASSKPEGPYTTAAANIEASNRGHAPAASNSACGAAAAAHLSPPLPSEHARGAALGPVVAPSASTSTVAAFLAGTGALAAASEYLRAASVNFKTASDHFTAASEQFSAVSNEFIAASETFSAATALLGGVESSGDGAVQGVAQDAPQGAARPGPSAMARSSERVSVGTAMHAIAEDARDQDAVGASTASGIPSGSPRCLPGEQSDSDSSYSDAPSVSLQSFADGCSGNGIDEPSVCLPRFAVGCSGSENSGGSFSDISDDDLTSTTTDAASAEGGLHPPALSDDDDSFYYYEYDDDGHSLLTTVEPLQVTVGALSGYCSLQTLSLCKMDIGRNIVLCAALGATLAKHSQLQKLELCDNDVCDAGLAALFESMGPLPNICELQIVENVGVAAAGALAATLPAMTTLRSVRLQYFRALVFDNEEGRAFFQALGLLPNLEVLGMHSCLLTAVAGRRLADSLRCLRWLREVDLSDNELMGNSGVTQVARALSKLPDLQILNLTDVGATMRGIRSIGWFFRRHGQIKECWVYQRGLDQDFEALDDKRMRYREQLPWLLLYRTQFEMRMHMQ